MKVLFFTSLLLINFLASAQNIRLDINEHNLEDFIKIEKSNGGEMVIDNGGFYSKQSFAPWLVFTRIKDKGPSLSVAYFYNKKDHSISSILYDWEDTSFHIEKSNSVENSKEINLYTKKYKIIYSKIFNEYGAGMRSGRLNNAKENKVVDIERKDTWQLNDKEIKLEIILPTLAETLGYSTICRVYRIRLFVNSKKIPSVSNMQLLEEELKTL